MPALRLHRADPAQAQLQALNSRRSQLIAQRRTEKQRLDPALLPRDIIRDIERHIRFLNSITKKSQLDPNTIAVEGDRRSTTALFFRPRTLPQEQGRPLG